MSGLLDTRDIRASVWVFPTKSNAKIAIDEETILKRRSHCNLNHHLSHAMTANKPAKKCILFGLFSRLCRCCGCAEFACSVFNTTQNNAQYAKI